MVTKLKNLKIKKVDFVDEGANPDAYIKLFKSKEGKDFILPEANSEKNHNILNKLISFLTKSAGMKQEEIDSTIEEISKEASSSFHEKYNEIKNRKIMDEMWEVCSALQSSLYSILNEEELDEISVQEAMNESLEEFHTVVMESIKQWSRGREAGIEEKQEEVTETDLEIIKHARDRLDRAISKSYKEVEGSQIAKENLKGEEMKIDKSKLTPAELAFLNSIEKRCGTEEINSVLQTEKTKIPAATDIYKGLHPIIKAELEELKKFKEAAENSELQKIAKKYAIIGKTEEELVPVLKSLKTMGGTIYQDMIAVLDQAVDAVEKSGVFSEIGKSGHGGDSSAEAKIHSIAKNYMEKDPMLSYNAAVAKAWEENPDIIGEYEEEAGF